VKGGAAGALLVGQSGGPTPVINASLYGVTDEALKSGQFSRVLGALHGVEGILGNQIADLGGEQPDQLSLLRDTPAAALGSCRYKLRDDDLHAILDVFRAQDVRVFVYAGGNDSADTAHRVAAAAAHAGYDLRVLGVPKTVDNDLPVTDHCPGYGSAARFAALASLGAGRDTEAMRRTDPVKIVEVMGRYAGWLAAGAALGRRDTEDAPHLVYVPEQPVPVEAILADVERVHRELGFAVVVLCENQPDASGRVLGAEGTPHHVDAFGHAYFESPAVFLAQRIQDVLGLRARYDKPGSVQRSFPGCVSSIDRLEAEQVGRDAVRAALAGETDQMVVLSRDPDGPYRCRTGLAPLQAIANQQKLVPAEFYDARLRLPTEAFRAYALPLIGDPLPPLARLRLMRV
jgi:6-phosphofructokinase 1